MWCSYLPLPPSSHPLRFCCKRCLFAEKKSLIWAGGMGMSGAESPPWRIRNMRIWDQVMLTLVSHLLGTQQASWPFRASVSPTNEKGLCL